MITFGQEAGNNKCIFKLKVRNALVAEWGAGVRMGFLDRLTQMLGIRKKEANVLVVGLDNSGTDGKCHALLSCIFCCLHLRWFLVVHYFLLPSFDLVFTDSL